MMFGSTADNIKADTGSSFAVTSSWSTWMETSIGSSSTANSITNDTHTLLVPPELKQCIVGCTSIECVCYCIALLIGITLIADVFVVGRIIADRRLHTETFTAIACLAFSDVFFCCFIIVDCVEGVLVTGLCYERFSWMTTHYYQTAKGIAWFSSNGHIALIAVLRFYMVVFPFKMKTLLSPKKVIVASVVVWVTVSIIFISLTIIRVRLRLPKGEEGIELGTWGVVYVLPVVITAVSHLVKLYFVKTSIQEFGNPNIMKQYAEMSRMIMVIIVLAAVFPLPTLIINFLENRKVDFPAGSFQQYCRIVAFLFYNLNTAVNPFIYAFLSSVFWGSIKMIGKSRRSIFLSRSTRSIEIVSITHKETDRNGHERCDSGL